MKWSKQRLKSDLQSFPTIFKVIVITKKFAKELKNLITYRTLEEKEYVVLDNKKLVYINNSKVACSSIKRTFIKDEIRDDYSIHNYGKWKRKSKLNNNEKSYFIFTFVRNPFDRVVSCYESKYIGDRLKGKNPLQFDKYLLGALKKDSGFDGFVKKIIRIPDFLADRHFQSQYNLIFSKSGKCLVDYYGKFENMDEDFLQIQEQYDLESLPHFNRTSEKNWKKYYTKETAKLVYEKYKKEIYQFGYEQDYIELIEYLDEEGDDEIRR